MQRIAVAGALAYDQICTTTSGLINPDHPLLNRKLSDISEAYGGCGGNIAYNLGLLDQSVQLLSCTGTEDDADYLQHLAHHDVNVEQCMRVSGHASARAIIFTDPQGHQFTGFYPGPVPTAGQWQEHLRQSVLSAAAIFVQAPYPPKLMLAGLAHFQAHQPQALRIWVPGQYADQLTAAEASGLLSATDWVIGNAHEIKCLEQHLDLHETLVIQTHGAAPIHVLKRGKKITIEVPPVHHAVDPTGCGDAFVAGLASNLATASNPRGDADESTLRSAVKAGCRMSAACLVHNGAQQHTVEALTL